MNSTKKDKRINDIEKSNNSQTDKATKSSNNNLSPSTLATNKNGLPFLLQKIILINVWKFQGVDDFVRDVCNADPSTFGERNSSRRKACLQKRRHFVRLQINEPHKFKELCSAFQIVEDSSCQQQEETEKEIAITTNTFETPKVCKKTRTTEQDKSTMFANKMNNFHCKLCFVVSL
jgi:hypothetical protein